MNLPRFFSVRQSFDAHPAEADPAAAVEREVERVSRSMGRVLLPGRSVALALGSRGVSKLTLAFGQLADAEIFIDDTAGTSILEMRAKARRLKLERGMDLLMVDYLQLVRGRGRYENRTQEISDISRSLKALAKELDVPVIAISQLSRAPENRGGDHRPQLSDLRESGAIEQDADLVAFIFREEVYHPDEENRGRATLIIGKQRNGPIGDVDLVFLKEYTRFENPEFRVEG